MKTLRFFGMMLMTVLMAFNMTACGDDDDDDNGGGSNGGSYVGIWIMTDQTDRMEVLTLKASSWQNDIYKLISCSEYKKETKTGSLSVNGDKLNLSNGPFTSASFSISDNTMTIIPDQKTEDMDRVVLTRATDDQIKKIAAWEALVLAYQQQK